MEENRQELSRNAFRRLLESRYLSPVRVREWRALHRQLKLACRQSGLRVNRAAADYAALHRALLAGSLSFIGIKRDAEAEPRGKAKSGARRRDRLPEYDGPRGVRFRLFPGSALKGGEPKWVMAAELSVTGATWARCVAAVAPEWIEAAAPHIKRTTHSEPYWDSRRGQAMVRERATVYGLTVVADRPRPAEDVDAAAARAMFLLEALVRRAQQPPARRLRAAFLDRNEALRQRLAARQAWLRRGDLLASEKAVADFYDARMPAEIRSAADCAEYVGGLGDEGQALLAMAEADLLPVGAMPPVRPEDFPSRFMVGDHEARLAYKFAPGEPDDGVTLRIDLGRLAAVDADALAWLVPGFFAGMCEAALRGLPKSLRRQLAPIPERARLVGARLSGPEYRQGSLARALSAAILATVGVRVPAEQWRLAALPDHLRMNVQVRGRRGRVLDQDRDIEALRRRLLPAVERAIARTADQDGVAQRERRAITEFPVDGVPDTLLIGKGIGRVVAYPVLVDRKASVDLVIHATRKGQRAINRGGYSRLALLADPRNARYLERELAHDAGLALRYVPVGPFAELVDEIMIASAWYAYFEGCALPTTRRDFEERLAANANALVPTFQEVHGTLNEIVRKRTDLARWIDLLASPALAETRRDLARQLDGLVGHGFLATLPRDRLADLPRYLDAMAARIDGLDGRVARDRVGMAAVAPWEERLAALAKRREDTAELAFLVQEYRVAVFSQRLGTRGKVSPQRLEKRFAAVEALSDRPWV